MAKVEKKVDDEMIWLNNKMQEFQKAKKHETPSISPSQIFAEKTVCA